MLILQANCMPQQLIPSSSWWKWQLPFPLWPFLLAIKLTSPRQCPLSKQQMLLGHLLRAHHTSSDLKCLHCFWWCLMDFWQSEPSQLKTPFRFSTPLKVSAIASISSSCSGRLRSWMNALTSVASSGVLYTLRIDGFLLRMIDLHLFGRLKSCFTCWPYWQLNQNGSNLQQ